LGIRSNNFDDMQDDMHSELASRPDDGCLDRFAPMTWLLSQDDLQFFGKFPRVAAQFRRNRYKVFLSYLEELHAEIAAFNRESNRLIAHGAWDLMPFLLRKRALLFYHELRLRRAALSYRWLSKDVSPAVAASLATIFDEVGLSGATV
jgi:hypothetical protein